MKTSAADSPSSLKRVSIDFDLPFPDVQPPNFPDRTLAEVYARNAEVMRETVYDEEYFARSLARKVTEPFVMR
jgi:hypothetical protein